MPPFSQVHSIFWYKIYPPSFGDYKVTATRSGYRSGGSNVHVADSKGSYDVTVELQPDGGLHLGWAKVHVRL